MIQIRSMVAEGELAAEGAWGRSMKRAEHYESDILFFFEGKPEALALYQCLLRRMEERFPEAAVRVQKTQISFYGRHLFAMVSLPRRRKEQGILVSLGLPQRLESLRIAAAVEPYPGRWTHHIPVKEPTQIDDELLDWMQEAWAFAESKG